MIHPDYWSLKEVHDQLIGRLNQPEHEKGVLFTRYTHPVLTRDHVPVTWRYDLDAKRNPYFLERLGVNATFNPGAIYWQGQFILAVRLEGVDRKSVFALAASPTGVDQFKFLDAPLIWADLEKDETNQYDMRLVAHEDGYVYGIFCSEKADPDAPPGDTTSAVAETGLVRTQDVKTWERLPNLKTPSPQQRNVVLHPTFIDGQYGFYTRPQDGFIETGSGGGIHFGLCTDITQPHIENEWLVDGKQYHTISEMKNGQGPAPILTKEGWLHIAHGVRQTAAGLRYVLYAFLTDRVKPWQVIAKPGGYLLAPRGSERTGDVSNVLFTNGAILHEGIIYLYYASSDTRIHVATSPLEHVLDYVLHTPADPGRSLDCAKTRRTLIEENQRLLNEEGR